MTTEGAGGQLSLREGGLKGKGTHKRTTASESEGAGKKKRKHRASKLIAV